MTMGGLPGVTPSVGMGGPGPGDATGLYPTAANCRSEARIAWLAE